MDYIYILVGLVLLYFGGEALLKGAISLAQHFKISKLLVGVVIIGFGTSMPELVVSVDAALGNQPDIALGNIVGSNIANVILIMALCLLIYPATVNDRAVQRDTLMVVFSSILLAALSFTGVINFWAGIGFLATLTGYVIWSVRHSRKQLAAAGGTEDIEGEDHKMPTAIGFVLIGLAVLIVGARLLVDGATSIARTWGVSEAVIGLTLVAVGTSLPELATGIVAAMKKQGEVVIGNILGSNFYNILGILGVTGIIAPIRFTGQIAQFDVWFMLAIAMALIPMLRYGRKITRVEASFMLVVYSAYVIWLYNAGAVTA
jgi:cation:H+ antiporter